MARGMFHLPVHHDLVMARIRSLYQNVQNSDVYMKDLDLAKIIRELVSKYICILPRGLLQVHEYAHGTKLVLLIEKLEIRAVTQLAFETRQQRPLTPPPDPISFQQQRKMETEE